MAEKVKKKKSAKWILILILIALAATIALVFLSYRLGMSKQNKEDTTQITMMSGISEPEQDLTEVREQKKVGFPYMAQDGSIVDIKASQKGIFILEDGSLVRLNRKGREHYCIPHSYTKPGLCANGTHAVIFDKASDRFRVFDENGEIYNGSTQKEGKILCADMANKGRFVLVTSLSGRASDVQLFDANQNKVLFEWKCTQGRPAVVELSDNGKNLAIGALDVSDGTITSMIYIMNINDMKSPEPYYCQSGAILSLRFLSDKKISVLTNTGRILINKDREEIGYFMQVDSSALECFSEDENGNTAVLTTALSAPGMMNLTVLDKNNIQCFEPVEIKNAVRVCISDGEAYVLGKDSVYSVNKKGKIRQIAQVQKICSRLCVEKGNVYSSDEANVYCFS